MLLPKALSSSRTNRRSCKAYRAFCRWPAESGTGVGHKHSIEEPLEYIRLEALLKSHFHNPILLRSSKHIQADISYSIVRSIPEDIKFLLLPNKFLLSCKYKKHQLSKGLQLQLMLLNYNKYLGQRSILQLLLHLRQ